MNRTGRRWLLLSVLCTGVAVALFFARDFVLLKQESYLVANDGDWWVMRRVVYRWTEPDSHSLFPREECKSTSWWIDTGFMASRVSYVEGAGGRTRHLERWTDSGELDFQAIRSSDDIGITSYGDLFETVLQQIEPSIPAELRDLGRKGSKLLESELGEDELLGEVFLYVPGEDRWDLVKDASICY